MHDLWHGFRTESKWCDKIYTNYDDRERINKIRWQRNLKVYTQK